MTERLMIALAMGVPLAIIAMPYMPLAVIKLFAAMPVTVGLGVACLFATAYAEGMFRAIKHRLGEQR